MGMGDILFVWMVIGVMASSTTALRLATATSPSWILIAMSNEGSVRITIKGGGGGLVRTVHIVFGGAIGSILMEEASSELDIGWKRRTFWENNYYAFIRRRQGIYNLNNRVIFDWLILFLWKSCSMECQASKTVRKVSDLRILWRIFVETVTWIQERIIKSTFCQKKY